MKKIFCIIFTFLFGFSVFSQNLSNVYLENEIYKILDYAQLKGYCSFLVGAKPYTQKQILNAIYEILDNSEKLSQTEIKTLNTYIELFNQKKSEQKHDFTHAIIDNKNENLPMSLVYDFKTSVLGSGGLYFDKSYDQFGIDASFGADVKGDFSKYISYRVNLDVVFSTMPLMKVSDDYFIGYIWYDENGNTLSEPNKKRTINKFLNNSFLPYDYSKPWDGSIYLLTNMNAAGLEGWATELGVAPSLLGEINVDFFDSKLQGKFGRYRRSWAAMDVGSSLILNENARPFMAGEVIFQPFKFMKFSTLTGGLEYPNQDYILENSYTSEPGMNDANFWQNLFSLNMIELDYKYFHFDFGSSTVWPKRFDIGYLFPLLNYVIYQNNLGDYDNTALFGDIKVRKPGVGSLWASLFLDEVNGFNNDIRTSSRAMYAGQLGAKVVIPGLNFGTLSVRYTKVEPYCYTHQAINYTPWYDKYIYENYSNNGSCLGYYLDPNSDETFIRFECKPTYGLNTAFQYQFIRHGADYGSQQVPGSSLYSELSPKNRDLIEKYFLRDGAYNWMHIIKLEATYENRNKKLPFCLTSSVGFLYSYYTGIDDEIYKKRFDYDKKEGYIGNSGADKNTKYSFIDTAEYPVQCGFVLSLGVKLWSW